MQIISFEDSLGQWQAGFMSDAQMSIVAFLLMGLVVKGDSFTQKRIQKKLVEAEVDLSVILDEGCFRGIRPRVILSLKNWLAGEWKLKLITKIPSPLEVLKAQAQGFRYVTMLPSPVRWNQPVLTKKNAFEFLCHDLEHAHQFWSCYHQEQLSFNQQLLAFYQNGALSELESAEFIERCHYLMSDMNTHPEHSSQFLRALWFDFYKRNIRDHNEINSQVERKMQSFMSINIQKESVYEKHLFI